MKVLVAEDTPALAEAMAYCLRRGGHTVELASDGERALHGLREDTQLLVLDLGLPAIDGVRVLQAARERRPEMPVLVSSASDTAAERLAAHGLRADAYLAKPFGIADFERVVAALAWRFGLAEHETSALPLTDGERRLLALLSVGDGGWMETDQIARQLAADGGRALAGDEVQRCIDGLRDKLAAGAPVRLVRVRGLGFGLMPPR